MEIVTINTEYIKLDQFLKWTGICESGAEAKIIIASGSVRVNGNIEKQRGKKLFQNDIVEFKGKKYHLYTKD